MLAKPEKYIAAGARISSCGIYRYSLWREWRGTHHPNNWRWLGGKDGAGAQFGEPKTCLFVMLNPSTADGEKDDATIRRCVGFAKAWKFERLEVVNLFAYRATKPRDVLKLQNERFDIIGWKNSELVAEASLDAGLIVCAWGSNVESFDPTRDHVETVRGWLGSKPQFALGFTKDGHPRHPLYAPASAMPVPMPD
jgi:hypothetical protein